MLKDYQQSARDIFENFVDDVILPGTTQSHPTQAWEEWTRLQKTPLTPVIRKDGRKNAVYHIRPSWFPLDESKPDIPFICTKMPTGAGKTIMAGLGIESIQLDFLKRKTGLVLWVVPSDAIYKQTIDSLRNRGSMLRQILERASGGRVKILGFRRDAKLGLKISSFSKSDIETKLCILVTTRQAFHIKGKESDEVKRKFFDQNGEFEGFFPDQNDAKANADLLKQIPELDWLGSEKAEWARAVKMSLANVLRMVNPIIVIDEAHIAANDEFRTNIASLRPSFVFEMTATPESEKHNVLIDVTGKQLHDEEMIKLPINLLVEPTQDWTQVIRDIWAKLQHLDTLAQSEQGQKHGLIRPIAVLRVSATGKDQKDKGKLHADDVKEFIINTIGLPAAAVKIKSASEDELSDQNLMEPNNPVRFVITKDALKEGWDCPFAYILGVLSKSGSETALTQMIGRVLRQPYTRRTGIQDLDQCYVYTLDGDTEKLAKSVKKGLEQSGLKDISDSIVSSGSANPNTPKPKPKPRADATPTKALVPTLLDANGRPISYDEHILGNIHWFDLAEKLDLDKLNSSIKASEDTMSSISIGLSGHQNQDNETTTTGDLDEIFLVRQLIDIFPHPWAADILIKRTLEHLRDEHRWTENRISKTAPVILRNLRELLKAEIDNISKRIFEDGLASGTLSVQLDAVTINDLVLESEVVTASDDDVRPYQRNLVENFDPEALNGLEKKAANKLDGSSSVQYWAKLKDRTSLSLQGWRRHKINPDFVVVSKHADASNTLLHRVLETKGNHLATNDDSAYKKAVFEVLNAQLKNSKKATWDALIFVEDKDIPTLQNRIQS